MSIATSLSEEQINQIQAWADGGDVLSDIQRKLNEEMEVKATYLETRFLLEDLKIELLPTPEPKKEEEEVQEEGAEAAVSGDEPTAEEAPIPNEEETPAPTGDESATVTIDKVLRAGALVSGRVVFNGGDSASWWLDQMGRLGFEADTPEFKPSEAQAMAFQQELQIAIQESGI